MDKIARTKMACDRHNSLGHTIMSSTPHFCTCSFTHLLNAFCLILYTEGFCALVFPFVFKIHVSQEINIILINTSE